MPYQGSKNKIAEWVISNLPPGDVLVDLFAGGCAITHAALVSGNYKKVIANDITDVPSLFVDAVNGKFANEKRWISREDFFKHKDTEPYVSLCWSFGNNRRSYMYSKEIADIFQEYGITVGNFIKRTQMEKAKQLIEETNISIDEIAEKVGYSDRFAFSKAFLSYEGMSPSKFRSSLKK